MIPPSRAWAGNAKLVKVKGSQEAHEAIRPALVGNKGSASAESSGGGGGGDGDELSAPAGGGRFLHPSELPLEGELEGQQRALYDLVYRRTLASAMAESEADFTAVSLGGGVPLPRRDGGDNEEEEVCVFCAAVCSVEKMRSVRGWMGGWMGGLRSFWWMARVYGVCGWFRPSRGVVLANTCRPACCLERPACRLNRTKTGR